MAEGFYKSTYIYVSPAEYCTVKLHVWIGYEIANHGALGLSNTNPNSSTLKDYFNGWRDTPVIHLFVKIGLYSILLGVCVLLIIVFKQGRYMLCAAPLLMVFIGCLLSPVNGYYRYAYPMIAGVPVVLADLLVTVVRQMKRGGSARQRQAAAAARRSCPGMEKAPTNSENVFVSGPEKLTNLRSGSIMLFIRRSAVRLPGGRRNIMRPVAA